MNQVERTNPSKLTQIGAVKFYGLYSIKYGLFNPTK